MNAGNRAVFAAFQAIGRELRLREQYLSELDSAVGDGDHGVTLVRCWDALERRMIDVENDPLPDALDALGIAVVATGGGAIGPLLGIALVKAGDATRAGAPPSLRIAAALEAAEEGIRSRGRARVGDRTLLDALHPASEAARLAAGEGCNVSEVVSAAAAAADEGAKRTARMVARAGRATRMGEQALGHMDPGAVSVAIMFRAAADHLTTTREGIQP
jgi:dihydroxyacetone kinase-like protein